MKILNLACGANISCDPDVFNIDWSFFLRAKKSVVPMFLREVVMVLTSCCASQRPIRRKRGETQLWMYERVNLAHLLIEGAAAPFLDTEARKPALQPGVAQ